MLSPLKLRWTFFLLGLVAVVLAIRLRAEPDPVLVVQVTGEQQSIAQALLPTAVARTELHAGTPAAHSATLARLPDGEILAYWFAGRREGAGDVRIFGARYKNGAWSSAEPVVTVAHAMRDTWRFLRKLGNPVAVVDTRGRLHLFFVSVSVGGWATSNLNQMTSHDGGRTWGRAHVLVTSPFLNLSTLARTPAVLHADGGFDLPVYHELARKLPELLRFDHRGYNVQKNRMSAAGAFLQPAAVALNEREMLAMLRDASPTRRLQGLRSDDGGRTWSAPFSTDQNNPDAAVALARLADGTLLLAYNPRTDGRSELALATSADGVEWIKRRVVEFEPEGEFSYPTLLVAADDEVHLVYTWQRKHIRHVRFGRDWLDHPTEANK